jgi:hypothetical protein
MSRVLGIAFALVLVAGASRADEDRSAYARASARLTEQLNLVISERVQARVDAQPPAKRDASSDELASLRSGASR